MPEFTIRLATLADAEAIRAIYNYYVTHSTCTYQIELETAEERAAWMRERSEKYPATVAEADGQIIAWAALSPWKSRCGYAWAAEASVYVHHEHHRRGLGRTLLLDLIERAKQAGLHTIIGGTSSDQQASLALQYAVGFELIGTFREVGRKFDHWLDVTYTQLTLPVSLR
ncbi:gnat family acetyltransferase : Putative acetyltransferase OS=uncultured Verrucomicrobia bacterium PE=4 SV=1: Acetyltransf_4 [Gemmata massiliana]|uniref:N-acetyltransferase domain-containing protein n=1 Tax=Gemmata massiliana TaxID=1210884 RepID=A0A6P2DGJ7_9BACT|nr:GNAT family N-acetyltransferase [Gemmata massiliana]VTR98811.1 gnat family acetyltransferase : Putative acetyltransferase OS=uncultured Verrucomicrobia bacterium PE=4 SV=1: Acetyltransf_4 [Gemmata massiliana]